MPVTPSDSIMSEYGHPKGSAGGSGVIGGLASADLCLPVSFATADAAVLYTVPVGFRMRVLRTYWENTVAWSGGSSSAIGASSSNASNNTKGDLQGGASGDLAAALGTGIKPGTLGAKFGSNGVVVLEAGDTVRFDQIASAFTAGAGYLHVEVQLVGKVG